MSGGGATYEIFPYKPGNNLDPWAQARQNAYSLGGGPGGGSYENNGYLPGAYPGAPSPMQTYQTYPPGYPTQ